MSPYNKWRDYGFVLDVQRTLIVTNIKNVESCSLKFLKYRMKYPIIRTFYNFPKMSKLGEENHLTTKNAKCRYIMQLTRFSCSSKGKEVKREIGLLGNEILTRHMW